MKWEKMTTALNGDYRKIIYLVKNEIVTGSGLKGINGEKNYVREGYVYKNRLYQVFSGRLHISKWSN